MAFNRNQMFRGLLVCALFFSLSAAAFADAKVLARWSQMKSYRDSFGGELDVRATYYSAEYIEALVKKEAEKNLWTENEMEQYKYQLLSGLSLDEYIPIHVEFDNRGPSMHLAPFDSFLTLWVGKNKLSPADFDKRFNFSFQGKREGLVFFPRYDKKGKSYLEGVKTIRFTMAGAISSVTINLSTLDFIWDVYKDNPEALYKGRAAARLELDRLIKRIEKLNAEKRELEGKLSELNAELDTITHRVEELQRQ